MGWPVIRHRKTVSALALAAVALYALVIDGPVHDLVTNSVPTVVTTDAPEHGVSGVQPGDTVVYFNGIQGSGLTHSVAIRHTWSRYGSVAVVEYARYRFSASDTVRTTFNWLIARHARRVTVIGVSMGGLLALDLLDMSRIHHSGLILRLILQDVPAGATSLKQPGAELTRVLHPGWLLNLVSPQIWSLFGTPTSTALRGSGANAVQINADDHDTLTWPVSCFTQQLRYIITRALPAPGAYADIPMVYVQSTLDSTVSNDSTYWLSVFGSHRLVNVVGTHSGLVAYPDAYRAGYIRAFGLFPPWALSSPSSASSAKSPVAQTYLGFSFGVELKCSG